MGQVPSILRLALIYGILVEGIYGILLAFIPSQFALFIGSMPPEAVWQRWSGGVLLALAIGQYRVLINPQKQETFIVTMMLVALFTAIGLIVSFVMHEYSAHIFWIVFPIVLTLVQTVLLFMAWQSSQRLLR